MKNIITDKLGEAQKAGDKSRILTLRLIIAAIKDKEIAWRISPEIRGSKSLKYGNEIN